MEQITLYLDMDGVLTNFEKAYRAMWNEYEYDRERFREAVLSRGIFETLEWMPNAEIFIDEIRRIEKAYSNLTVEMLTSTGSHRTDMKLAAMTQKTQWLMDHDIHWKANFVCAKPEKSQYAGSYKILIDDMAGCTEPFIEKGGIAFIHKDSDYRATIDRLDWCLDELTKEFV
jgi:hypothetical protein